LKTEAKSGIFFLINNFSQKILYWVLSAGSVVDPVLSSPLDPGRGRKKNPDPASRIRVENPGSYF
jgi:hypothetical protein